jgi:hypothetical protein
MADTSSRFILAVILCLVLLQTWALAQTLGTAPQFDRAVQGQTGAQPEGAFFNIINWVGAVVGGIVSYATGRAPLRWFVTAGGLLAVSGVTRVIGFFITQKKWGRSPFRAGRVLGTRRQLRAKRAPSPFLPGSAAGSHAGCCGRSCS